MVAAAVANVAADVEIVFDNAGILLPAPLLTGDFERVTATFDVDVFGLLRAAGAFAPALAANGGAHW
ncbi:hypothetical protein ACWCQQ_49460 [Streptomyces sp. NPDC002143]